MVGGALDKARDDVKKENNQISEVLGHMVDYAISRANSSIRNDEEVYLVVDPLLQQTLANARTEIAKEKQELNENLISPLITEALVKASTGVQSELNLKQMLIATFAKVVPLVTKLEKAATLEEIQLLLKDQMVNSFKTINALSSYFTVKGYKATDSDKQMREHVEEALKEAGIIASKVKLTPIVDEKPVEDPKVSADATTGAYQEKLQKLQKKISQFEAYVEEKDQALLEQETQLSDLQDQLHVSQKNEALIKKKLDEAVT